MKLLLALIVVILAVLVTSISAALPRKCYKVYGKNGCLVFEDAKSVVQDRARRNPSNFKADVYGFSSDAWYLQLENLNKKYKVNRRSSPFILEGCVEDQERVVGGRDNLMDEFAKAEAMSDAGKDKVDV